MLFRSLASLGGGTAVAYIFVHLMPELAVGGKSLTELNIAKYTPTPITEAALFLTAMVGMVVFFTLDVLAQQGKSSTRTNFTIHLIAFGVLSGLYAYTLPALVTTGWAYAALFTFVLAVHTLLADRTMARAHPRLFAHETRWVGVAGVAAGLACAILLPPANELVLATAIAFLGGVLLMVTFREELPQASRTRLPWFLGGLTLMTIVLLMLLDLAKP